MKKIVDCRTDNGGYRKSGKDRRNRRKLKQRGKKWLRRGEEDGEGDRKVERKKTGR